MEILLLVKIFFTLVLLCFFSLFLYVYTFLWLKPQKLRSKLQRQGINGPPSSFLLGNIPLMKKIKSSLPSSTTKKAQSDDEKLVHDYASSLFPYFNIWSKQYGQNFTFSLGNIPILYVSDPLIAKEISLCTSIDLGKPKYQQVEHWALLGKGIITSNGSLWTHQRKTIAPELYMQKVKGMVTLMVEAGNTLVKTWEKKIGSEKEPVDIKVDDDLKNFTTYIISRLMFGSSYAEGLHMFSKLGTLMKALSKPNILAGIPGLRYLPTKNNRNIVRLEKEVRLMILDIAKKKSTKEDDLLHMIIEGAHTSKLGPKGIEEFIVDNCKNIYLAGFGTTAIATLWSLVMLASYPEWQTRVRAEIVEICEGRLPDWDMLRKMKTLTMVIQEVLRLYPSSGFTSREALEDMKFGHINVPKGVNIWLAVLTLHMDPDIWGPDAHIFNPERFGNGVMDSCKIPQAYLPFGVGPRICVGQNFAMVQMKVLLALILSNFSFSLSPKYVHSPVFNMVIEPGFGVNILVSRV